MLDTVSILPFNPDIPLELSKNHLFSFVVIPECLCRGLIHVRRKTKTSLVKMDARLQISGMTNNILEETPICYLFSYAFFDLFYFA
ncbi:MAG: hypothetical protein LBL00_01870 [Endomicrobium sp.]|nr:hypothetical protein [Endomicrobium sp.]